MNLQKVSHNTCFGGTQLIYQHDSICTGTPMRFSIYLPPQAINKDVPILWWLSGLTCTEENFTFKAGAQRYAAEYSMAIVAPDTSPRGANIDGEDESYDFGTGAGFYVDATESPWNANYNMYSYITDELQRLVIEKFPVSADKQAIFGHSMGGHGAITIALRNPNIYESVSAFAPICAPTQVPWGRKALCGYLGKDESMWQNCDSVRLINAGNRIKYLLVDQGDADEFLENQLKPELLKDACEKMRQPLELRMQPDYDHSYYFISSFIGEHVAFHAKNLK